ncbi:LysR family transcriptional regulator [Pseudomonas coronafaciens pv. garcae]|uniref:LysR family transcriptional regulator n=4 Tax=Pseudomonas syringae group TaxID=136849 RepID=A0AB37QMX4_9PSED|nr:MULTISPECIES: LysR family transcriptional regulator [Pseudomonas syringae group]KOP53884.1 LysR family transcriptional regulator [Pseudomonas coronafaciens pv. porri]KOP56156.1 LysR family transcriptional regulator [Pseudomonas coronafaciens pv. porri]KPY25131.1 LysR family transcriptional regulator [Pseudomonas coronafaciens pv. porri]RMR99741.1 LysR family transcriptional regulator [Pseudomonas coronafaciens pv. garcae]RMS01448.1 LysR family transcriptional regulator [Pseudomonas coronafa
MIKELKTFIAVARDGTFAAAGDRIGLTQAAVSAQMQRLEAELGVKLFDRTGRSAQLNRMGQQVLLQAQELLQLYGNLGSDAVGLAPDVLVTLGAIASVQRSFLPDALALFHQQCPQCRTRIIPGLSMDLVNQVDAGEIDLAAIIRPPFSLHSDLRWTTLTREPYCLIVPADVRGDDWSALISNQPFIRYDRSSFGGRQVDRFLRQTHVALREVCELDELDAIVKLVANGVGVALVPQTAALQAWPAGVRAVDLGQHTFHRDIGLVHRARRSLAEPVKELARLLTAQGQEVQ